MYINHFYIYTDNFLGYRAAYDMQVSSFHVHQVLCRVLLAQQSLSRCVPHQHVWPHLRTPPAHPDKSEELQKTFNAAVISQSPGK